MQHLLDLLSSGARLSQSELAEELSCEKRHVRRLLGRLEAEGVPVREQQDGRTKRYFLAPEDQHHALRTVRLTERQLQALAVAIEAARSALRPTPLLAPLEEAAELLAEEWLAEAFTFEPGLEVERWSFDDGPGPAAGLDPDVFWALLDAMREHKPVRVDYFTASRGELTTGRKLDPYLFAVRRGSWMVTCYCRRSQAVKDFSLGGIRRLTRCEDERFVWKKGFDRTEHFAGRFVSLAGDELQAVRLLVSAACAPYFRRKQYHPSQTVEEERPDGDLVVRLAVRSLEEMQTFVLGWGGGVQVLGPEALRRHVADGARQVLRAHEEEEGAL